MFLLAGAIIAELAGQKWTTMRRQSAKSNKKSPATRKPKQKKIEQ